MTFKLRNCPKMTFRIFIFCIFISCSFQCIAEDKIALLFLTRSTPNHADVWKKLLKEAPGKYNVYVHSKEPMGDAFFQKRRISNIVSTTWSIHVKAWQALLQEAVKDKDNVQFAFLSEACIPLHSLKHIYSIITRDPRTHIAFARPWWDSNNPRELHTIDKEFRWGNAEWMVLNRKHAELVASDRAVIRLVSRHENDQESYFATLFAIHGCLFDDLCAHSYTYVNWNNATNGGASPYSFTDVSNFNDALLDEAYNGGALFARKFSKEYPSEDILQMIENSKLVSLRADPKESMTQNLSLETH
ncbi:MAG: hypothetical protein H0T62_01275 [Parachlamydiaceae bacterium]|nr:hypothetical protein [Parachlamydiaceae bacterium]